MNNVADTSVTNSLYLTNFQLSLERQIYLILLVCRAVPLFFICVS